MSYNSGKLKVAQSNYGLAGRHKFEAGSGAKNQGNVIPSNSFRSNHPIPATLTSSQRPCLHPKRPIIQSALKPKPSCTSSSATTSKPLPNPAGSSSSQLHRNSLLKNPAIVKPKNVQRAVSVARPLQIAGDPKRPSCSTSFISLSSQKDKRKEGHEDKDAALFKKPKLIRTESQNETSAKEAFKLEDNREPKYQREATNLLGSKPQDGPAWRSPRTRMETESQFPTTAWFKDLAQLAPPYSPSLFQLCIRRIRQSQSTLGELGAIPDEVLLCMLRGIPAEDLRRVEEANAGREQLFDVLWAERCALDFFVRTLPVQFRCWKDCYVYKKQEIDTKLARSVQTLRQKHNQIEQAHRNQQIATVSLKQIAQYKKKAKQRSRSSSK